jgi:hypothetical protein
VLALCAHLDTVPLSGPIEVTSSNGVLTNRHEAILGADNKAAVAVMLEVARPARGGGGPPARARACGRLALGNAARARFLASDEGDELRAEVEAFVAAAGGGGGGPPRRPPAARGGLR